MDVENDPFIIKILVKMALWIKPLLPNGNPDFDGLYDKVKTWYIEYDDENEYTNREIGIDKNDKVIVIAPYKRNLGVWVDSDLTLDDYRRFDINTVSSNEFNNYWEKYGIK